jgi:hypothetical protein
MIGGGCQLLDLDPDCASLEAIFQARISNDWR